MSYSNSPSHRLVENPFLSIIVACSPSQGASESYRQMLHLEREENTSLTSLPLFPLRNVLSLLLGHSWSSRICGKSGNLSASGPPFLGCWVTLSWEDPLRVSPYPVMTNPIGIPWLGAHRLFFLVKKNLFSLLCPFSKTLPFSFCSATSVSSFTHLGFYRR